MVLEPQIMTGPPFSSVAETVTKFLRLELISAAAFTRAGAEI